MSDLDELVRDTDDVVGMLRGNAGEFTLTQHFPAIPNEITNWIEEQRAIIETCALGDLSHHMTTMDLEGPDALEFLKGLCATDLDGLAAGRAKHIVLCDQRGYLLGDGPLLKFDDETFWGVPWGAENWLRYHLETTDLDVEASFDPPTAAKDGGDPETFIYQVQGPKAHDVLAELTDDDLESIGFYQFETVTLAGHEVRAFGHGMSTQPGFEFHGPWTDAEAVKDAILEAGEAHGIRHLGSKAYNSQSVRLGWIGAGPPPVYDDGADRAFRAWLGPDTREATFSIEGSFESADVTDYYMDPVEYGFGRLVSLDHDFVGRQAVAERLEAPNRRFVSLLWNDADVVEVYGSLFGDGPSAKYFELPRSRWATAAFDEVRRDGDLVGVSRRRSYQPDVRGIVSLAVVDEAYAEPGTEVEVVWGEGADSVNPYIEDHVQTTIRAEVAPVPYTEDLRKTTAASD